MAIVFLWLAIFFLMFVSCADYGNLINRLDALDEACGVEQVEGEGR